MHVGRGGAGGVVVGGGGGGGGAFGEDGVGRGNGFDDEAGAEGG